MCRGVGRRGTPPMSESLGGTPEGAPRSYPLRDGMGLHLTVDAQCDTRRGSERGAAEAWLIEVLDAKLRVVRFRHVSTRRVLALSSRWGDTVDPAEAKKEGVHTVFSCWSEKDASQTNNGALEFNSLEEATLGFRVDLTTGPQQSTGLGGTVLFYREIRAGKRIPLPYPRPSIGASADASSSDVPTSSESAEKDAALASARKRYQRDGVWDQGRVIAAMFSTFDRGGTGALSRDEMHAFAREICNYSASWSFENWWRYILIEYADETDPQHDTVLSFDSFTQFITDRPNKEQIFDHFAYRQATAERKNAGSDGESKANAVRDAVCTAKTTAMVTEESRSECDTGNEQKDESDAIISGVSSTEKGGEDVRVGGAGDREEAKGDGPLYDDDDGDFRV